MCWADRNCRRRVEVVADILYFRENLLTVLLLPVVEQLFTPCCKRLKRALMFLSSRECVLRGIVTWTPEPPVVNDAS